MCMEGKWQIIASRFLIRPVIAALTDAQQNLLISYSRGHFVSNFLTESIVCFLCDYIVLEFSSIFTPEWIPSVSLLPRLVLSLNANGKWWRSLRRGTLKFVESREKVRECVSPFLAWSNQPFTTSWRTRWTLRKKLLSYAKILVTARNKRRVRMEAALGRMVSRV